MKVSDLIQATFGKCGIWYRIEGQEPKGVEPQWQRDKWPSHTAEQMGPKWEAPKVKRAKAK